MSIVHIRHIKSRLTAAFRGKIDMSDYDKKSDDERETAFLSRAQAAYSLVMLADATNDTAAAAVTDGYQDNGIDAIHYDKNSSKLYLVQSKWHQSGNGSIAYDDILKFVKGLGDITEVNYSACNSKIVNLKPIIEQALGDINVSIICVTIHTGTQPLAPNASGVLQDFIAKINDPSPMAKSVPLNQKEIYNYIEREAKPNSINLEVAIKDWGQCKSPYHAYYGQVEAADIAAWYNEHGQSLFDANLRMFTGRTDVNNSIVATLLQKPEQFWYFNNGVTLLCSNLRRKAIGGKTRDNGIFVVDGASVVNGAQTVGSIAVAYRNNKAAVEKAKVNVRIISTASCPDAFPIEVTRAANTQNRIERRDFVALDPQQDRLRRELHIENEKQYVYKSGDPIPSPSDGCSIDEATVALACLQADAAVAVQAKRELGKLWEDTSKPPYKLLFHSGLTAISMWHAVDVMRKCELVLKVMANAASGKRKLVLIHGNRLILHCVFRKLPSTFLETGVDPTLNSMINALTRKAANLMFSEFNATHSGSYPASLFKNAAECKAIAEAVIAKLV